MKYAICRTKFTGYLTERQTILTHWPMRVEVILQVFFIHKLILLDWYLSNSFYLIDILSSSSEIGFKWVPQNAIDDKSKLIKVMIAWCCYIIWANVDPGVCLHIVSSGHNKSTLNEEWKWSEMVTEISILWLFVIFIKSALYVLCVLGTGTWKVLAHSSLWLLDEPTNNQLYSVNRKPCTIKTHGATGWVTLAAITGTTIPVPYL